MPRATRWALALAALGMGCAGERADHDLGVDDLAPTETSLPADGRATDGPRADRGRGDGGAGFTNLVIVGWDGVQRRHFNQCYKKLAAGCSAGLPNIEKLSGGKIFNSTVTSGATCTKPGWAQLLSGYDAEVMGIYDNTLFRSLPVGYSIFEKFEKHFGPSNIVTLFLAGKTHHVGGDCTVSPQEPWCAAKKQMDVYESGLGDNVNVGQKALSLLQTHQSKRLLAFFHFQEPDHTGHKSGESSAEYSAELVDDDAWLGKIVGKLQSLGIADRTLVYVITDHGFDEGLTSHKNAPYGIMASNDPQVIRSGDRRDVAPTVLKRFGISLGASGSVPAVDGKPLDSIPAGCIAEGKAYVQYTGAPTCCTGLGVVGLHKVDEQTGACIAPTGAASDGSGYCTKCGNGKCQAPENKCNCATDC